MRSTEELLEREQRYGSLLETDKPKSTGTINKVSLPQQTLKFKMQPDLESMTFLYTVDYCMYVFLTVMAVVHVSDLPPKACIFIYGLDFLFIYFLIAKNILHLI